MPIPSCLDLPISNTPTPYSKTDFCLPSGSLSQGQIQIIALARAILARTKIVVLDEGMLLLNPILPLGSVLFTVEQLPRLWTQRLGMWCTT